MGFKVSIVTVLLLINSTWCGGGKQDIYQLTAHFQFRIGRLGGDHMSICSLAGVNLERKTIEYHWSFNNIIIILLS